MTKVFYDYLIDISDLEKEIEKVSSNDDERLELSSIADELVHNKVVASILENLPKENHLEFLNMFHTAPHDDNLVKYLKEKIGQNFEEIIRNEIGNLPWEILGNSKKKTSKH